MRFAIKTEAIKPSDLNRVIVDTIVQLENVMFPTDASASEPRPRDPGAAGQAAAPGVAAIVCAGGQVRPDQASAVCPGQAVQARQPNLERFEAILVASSATSPAKSKAAPTCSARSAACWRGRRGLDQKQHQRGPKVYSLHAPQLVVHRARRPYEFGGQALGTTTLAHAKGGLFVTISRHCPATPMTAIRSKPSARTWRR